MQSTRCFFLSSFPEPRPEQRAHHVPHGLGACSKSPSRILALGMADSLLYLVQSCSQVENIFEFFSFWGRRIPPFRDYRPLPRAARIIAAGSVCRSHGTVTLCRLLPVHDLFFPCSTVLGKKTWNIILRLSASFPLSFCPPPPGS